jgi:recombination associated protein RdgC
MANLRRGGSASLFFIEGDLPSLQSPAFVAGLERQRFRSIENAASEEMSAGWVTCNDPSGETFSREDIDLDRCLWLQVRVDKKKLPLRWVAIYRAAAERAAGRKLSAKERKALKEDLAEQLLPRVLPAVQLLDVLIDHKQGRVLLFSTSKGARDEFTSLFRKTFAGVELRPADAFAWALRGKITPDARRYLEEVAPVQWPAPERRAARSRAAPEPLEVLADGEGQA